MGPLLRTAALSVALVLPAGAAGAQAPPADTLTVERAVTLALAGNPMLRAARLRADAALERVPQAGALPDPQLTLALMNRMVGDFGDTGEPMTMNQVQLTQAFPWPGVLGFAKQRADHLARAERWDADETSRMLRARVIGTYHDVAAMDRSLEAMHATRDLLRDFLGVSRTMYATGSGIQQDVLSAQVAIARMTEEITSMDQRRRAEAARLNALLGRAATEPVGALELPEPSDTLLPVDSLVALALARRPALRAAEARVEAAAAGYRSARRELYPELMVGVAYGERPQFRDMASLMLGIRVPLWAGARQLPMRREMLAEEAMASAEARDLLNETYAEIVELRSEAERSRNLVALYATSILPQAEAAVTAALAAYRVGRVDYMTLVDNQMTVNRYAIERFQLAAAYHRARAGIEALVGPTVGGGQ